MNWSFPFLCLVSFLLVAGPVAGQSKRIKAPAGIALPRQGIVPAAGFVPDSATAVKIAEAVWLPLFGPGIARNRPFKAYQPNAAVWVVSGSMADSLPFDDRPYIEIRRKDGQIIFVRRGKM